MPKVPHSVPKPLTVDKAARVVEPGPGAELEWTIARDAAVLLLLYGSGLRIAEALSIKLKDAPTGDRDVLRVAGKGGKERLVPVLPVVRAAIARYLALNPYPLAPDDILFRGAKGGPLSPRIIQLTMERMRGRSICPSPQPRMRCATPSPRTCCRRAATCARSRSSWATPPYPRPRPIRK